MLYSIAPTEKGQWQVFNTKTNSPYGDPLNRIEDAAALVREAEAQAVLDRMTACRTAACSI